MMTTKKTKFYKRISFLVVLFSLTIVFPSELVLAQEINFCLDGTGEFNILGQRQSYILWNSDPSALNDDSESTYIGIITTTPPFVNPFWARYESILTFAEVAPAISEVQYVFLGWALGVCEGFCDGTGEIKTSLYYNDRWNLIHEGPSFYNLEWPSSHTTSITTGAPWNNVTKIKVEVYIYSPLQNMQNLIYELRAFGPAAPVYQDIGLRVQTPTGIVSIAAEIGAPTSPLRIAKNGVIYGIALVDPGDPNDSGVRIQTSSEIKALRKIGSGGA